eukprot:526895-Amorphochlora_amoeboformis.AAC.1
MTAQQKRHNPKQALARAPSALGRFFLSRTVDRCERGYPVSGFCGKGDGARLLASKYDGSRAAEENAGDTG